MAKKKASTKKKITKPPKAKKQSRRAASQTAAGVGHNLPPEEYQTALEAAVAEIMEIKTTAEKDAMGYKTDIGNSLEAHAKTLGIRQSVLKDEIDKAWKRKKAIEKEKAYDPIERDQRQAIRDAMEKSDESWLGTPYGDLFSGVMAEPEGGGDEEEAEPEETEETVGAE